MKREELEDGIRAALRGRAEGAPVAVPHGSRDVTRRSRGPVLAAGALAVVVLAVAAVAVTAGDEPARVASGGSPTATSAADDGHHLGFDLPGFRYLQVDDDACRQVSPTESAHRLETFGTSYFRSPIMFVQTINDFGPESRFGLLDEEHGDRVTLRGVDGWAASDRSVDKGWVMNAILPDGDAIYVTVLGLDTEAAIGVVDSLERDAEGGWTMPTSPLGFHRLEPSRPASGCGYTAQGSGFEVNVYVDAFDSRLQDRVASTVGPVEQLDLAGLPAAIGDYRDDDHWVMAEPAPGLTLEIRASGMTRAEVLELVGHARFVDDEGWRAVQPAGSSDGPSGTAAPTSVTSVPMTDLEAGKCPGRPTGSSPAAFDPQGGTYASTGLEIAADGTLRFDIVQWLSGEDANEAHRREHPDDPEGIAPNDYYILNETTAVREAPVSDDAEIAVLRTDGNAAPLIAVSESALAEHLATSGQRTYWLTFAGSVITGICQQYRP